MVFTPLLLV